MTPDTQTQPDDLIDANCRAGADGNARNYGGLMTLMQADAFRGDWYGYVYNQAGHAAIVGFGLALLALTVLSALWVPPLVALLADIETDKTINWVARAVVRLMTPDKQAHLFVAGTVTGASVVLPATLS